MSERHHDKMTSEAWMKLARQIPYTETEAHRLIHERIVHCQSLDLIKMLSDENMVSLAGLSQLPSE